MPEEKKDTPAEPKTKKRRVETPGLYKRLEARKIGVGPLLGYFGNLIAGSVGSLWKLTGGQITGEIRDAAEAAGYKTKGKSPTKIIGEVGGALLEKPIDYTMKPAMHIAKTTSRFWRRAWDGVGSVFNAVSPKWLTKRVSKWWNKGKDAVGDAVDKLGPPPKPV